MLVLLILRLPVPLVLMLAAVLLAAFVPAAVVAVVPAVAVRRFGRRLGGLLRGRGADAENRRGGDAEGEVASCFHLDLLWLTQGLPAPRM